MAACACCNWSRSSLSPFVTVFSRTQADIPQPVGNRILRSRHAAGRLAHVFLQLLELFGHLLFFSCHLVGLLLRLAGLLTVEPWSISGVADHLAQAVLEVGLVLS